MICSKYRFASYKPHVSFWKQMRSRLIGSCIQSLRPNPVSHVHGYKTPLISMGAALILYLCIWNQESAFIICPEFLFNTRKQHFAVVEFYLEVSVFIGEAVRDNLEA